MGILHPIVATVIFVNMEWNGGGRIDGVGVQTVKHFSKKESSKTTLCCFIGYL